MQNIVYQGTLKDLNSSIDKEFHLVSGINPIHVLDMESKWTAAHAQTIAKIIIEADGSELKTQELLDNCQIEDRGWSWTNKYNHFKIEKTMNGFF